jgi:3',5'-cyclic-AMP phosphodiesterase
MKLVHISDLHIDAINKKENFLRTRKVLEYIRETGYDHLLITGDITENGDTDSFELTRKTLKHYGMLDDSKTSVVIGNHDIYGGVHLAEDVVNYPKKCKKTDFGNKVNEFEYYFRETFNNTYQPLKNNPFPYVKEFDNLVIVGLNSIEKYSVLSNPFASNGAVKEKQFTELEKILCSKMYRDKKKIVMIHHHFCRDTFENEKSGASFWNRIERRTMKLSGKKALMKIFNKYKVELILHGHLHESRKYYRKGLLFLNGGGTVLNDERNLLKINYINIENSIISTETLTIKYQTQHKIIHYPLPSNLQIYTEELLKKQTGIPEHKEIFLN